MTSRIILDRVSLRYPGETITHSFRHDLLSGLRNLFAKSKPKTDNTFLALDDISFSLEDGDRLGLLGPNGAGKSTLLRTLAGIYLPNSGTISSDGKISTLFSIGLGMDHDETGYNNIFICGLLVGMTPDEIEAKRNDIIEFSGLGEFIHSPVRTYSSGMAMRLSFSIATYIDPDILLIDEVFGVGDALFAKRAKERIESVMSSAHVLVIATHATAMLEEFCNKGLLLVGGQSVYFGDIDDAVKAYHDWIAENEQ